MRDIGSNIRILRIQKGITQEALAEKLFITRQAVSSYETGRTRPDIDMLIRIAEVLETDTNTLLYGQPPSAEHKKSKFQLLLCATFIVLLAVSYFGLSQYICTIAERFVVKSIPQNLIRVTLLPTMWFLIGWALLHSLLMLPGMPKIYFKQQKKTYVAAWIVLSIIIALQLPYVIFYATALYRSLTRTYVTMAFPNIPVYTQTATWLIIMSLRYGSGYAIWGAIIRFLTPTST